MSAITGIWTDAEGTVHLSASADNSGAERRERKDAFRPYLWASRTDIDALPETAGVTPLEGPGLFNYRIDFGSLGAYRDYVSRHRRTGTLDFIPSLESQYLLSRGERLFRDMSFSDLKRCQLDIETACTVEDGFSDARRAGDRVLAIGLLCGVEETFLVLEEDSDEAEKHLLQRLNDALAAMDPDVIEGHNIFRFDLDFLRLRAKRLKVPCHWGRFGREASFRPSRMKVAERWIDFPRCDIPGRTVFDTYLMVLRYDLSTREMQSYSLKEVALHLGVTRPDEDDRTYIAGTEIQKVFHDDRKRFLAYLSDDLRETRGVSDVLLPTYFAQAQSFPVTLQESCLRGSSGKIDLLLLEEYYKANAALPAGAPVKSYAGGFTRSFVEGVFRHVLHFDVASLYPSLLLNLARNPSSDHLGVFIPLLTKLRDYRIRYKNLARKAENRELQREFEARQASFKILINSFYGYLGFSGARFADGDLASEITSRGRELLQKLIETFQREGCVVLEADTDGIYVGTEEYYRKPEELLRRVAATLPSGIDLEFDGAFDAMFCYKAKNYALRTGERVIVRGSALRSRGMEPFLRDLTERLIDYLLGVETESPLDVAEEYKRRLLARELPLDRIIKTENLNMNPESYRKSIEEGGSKPRRASLEVALQMDPQPSMGDRVSYYIASTPAGGSADWQRARPVTAHRSGNHPYDPHYYIQKIDDWMKRYAEFLPRHNGEQQGELF